jgi:acetyltransferase-like isoleucine patch superfamily enzyme
MSQCLHAGITLDIDILSALGLLNDDIPTNRVPDGNELQILNVDDFGNIIIFGPLVRKFRGHVDFSGAKNCIVIIGKSEVDKPSNVKINLNGSENIVFLSGFGKQGPNTIDLHLNGNHNIFYAEPECTFVGATFIFSGSGRKVLIGYDCMFSWGITCRNHDSHAIFSLDDGQVMNSAMDLTFGKHVWVGQDVVVTRGVHIGSGSVIGARSVVTKDIPNCVIAAGTPASTIRERISWTRNPYPTTDEIDRVTRLVALGQV